MPTSRPVQTQDKLGEILTWYSDIEELKDEMEEWRDNTPESLQSSDKYQTIDSAAGILGTAADDLETACDGITKLLEKIPKDPDEMSILDLTVAYTEHKMYKGYPMPRWVRLANPCAALAAVSEKLEELKDSIFKDLTSVGEDLEEVAREFSEHISSIDGALSDLQGVEFPSMFG